MLSFSVLILTIFLYPHSCNAQNQLPLVITTWRFVSAAETAWNTIQNSTALDTIEKGCAVCEIEQCGGTVGFGGSPDESGETTLDALIMDGTTMNVGAVAAVRRIKNVISVARKVLEHTAHSMLAGDLATKFAVEMGFKEESLSTPKSLDMWKKWMQTNCQPNFWENVSPNPKTSCGPYSASTSRFNKVKLRNEYNIGENNHDTISMIAIDKQGNIAAGTSTNGARHKIPGRVGDSPITGAGAYADSAIGGAAATGDGDVMLRFLPSFLAVEEMRRGATPQEAATTAVIRIARVYPKFSGAVIAVNRAGDYGAACNTMESFPFSVGNPKIGSVQLQTVKCIQNLDNEIHVVKL